jgi:assimilatory nitrate reductase catalytic subunit
VLAKVAADGDVTVRGNPDHPANFGRLCSKGSALVETIDLDGDPWPPCRLGRGTRPRRFDLLANHRRACPGCGAFYVSGQLLTEDYYVANKLMKGFIGSVSRRISSGRSRTSSSN